MITRMTHHGSHTCVVQPRPAHSGVKLNLPVQHGPLSARQTDDSHRKTKEAGCKQASGKADQLPVHSVAPPTIENILILHDRPMVNIRDREHVTQVVKWNNLTTEILGSNPTCVHWLVWFPKACWWGLMKVETAVQVLAGPVWSVRILWHLLLLNTD